MDIVERLRKVFGVVVKADDCFDEDYTVARKAADEIENLRDEVSFLFKSIEAHQERIGKLTNALRAVVDAHGTGQGIGAQGAGSWLDQARQALEETE